MNVINYIMSEKFKAVYFAENDVFWCWYKNT